KNPFTTTAQRTRRENPRTLTARDALLVSLNFPHVVLVVPSWFNSYVLLAVQLPLEELIERAHILERRLPVVPRLGNRQEPFRFVGRGVHLFRLLDRHEAIVFAVDDQRRALVVADLA